MHDSNREPETGFAAFDLSSSIQRGIQAAGFTEPRPIQSRAIPAALEGRDILGLAQTGTGKTAAFALPLLERLLATRGGPDPQVLIVAPTRELASQISEEIRFRHRHAFPISFLSSTPSEPSSSWIRSEFTSATMICPTSSLTSPKMPIRCMPSVCL